MSAKTARKSARLRAAVRRNARKAAAARRRWRAPVECACGERVAVKKLSAHQIGCSAWREEIDRQTRAIVVAFSEVAKVDGMLPIDALAAVAAFAGVTFATDPAVRHAARSTALASAFAFVDRKLGESYAHAVTTKAKPSACPPGCAMCSGSTCALCGSGSCNHNAEERHRAPIVSARKAAAR